MDFFFFLEKHFLIRNKLGKSKKEKEICFEIEDRTPRGIPVYVMMAEKLDERFSMLILILYEWVGYLYYFSRFWILRIEDFFLLKLFELFVTLNATFSEFFL
jgi:hypothetical protein